MINAIERLHDGDATYLRHVSRCLSLVVIMLSGMLSLKAQNTLSIDQRWIEVGKLSTRFSLESVDNLAAAMFRQDYSLTTLAFDGFYNKESSPVLLQQGDGRYGGAFHAESYQHLKKKVRLWGEAIYDNVLKKNIRWNETSDYDLLYPYFSADTIGGDLRSETYYFKGGYAQEWKELVWGAEAEYRALLEYRNIDPRPRNTAADLKLKMGIGWNFHRNYYGVLSLAARRYKQTGSIAYYNESGNCITYHLTGLGMVYARFSGTNTSVAYQGTSGGVSLNILPENRKGYTFLADYNYLSYSKMLSDLNNIPLVEMGIHQVDLSLAWQDGEANSNWGMKLVGGITIKNGTENLFGDPAGNIYSEIASADMYDQLISRLGLQGFYEWQGRAEDIWHLQPRLSFATNSEKYLQPARGLSARHLIPAVEFGWSKSLVKTSFGLRASAEYGLCLQSRSSLADCTPQDSQYSLIMNVMEAMQADRLTTNLDFRINFPVKSKVTIFVQGAWQYYYYNMLDINASAVKFTVGVGI